MAVYVKRFDLVGTFICLKVLGERETEGKCNLEPVNYSQPAMENRHSITFLTTAYSELSKRFPCSSAVIVKLRVRGLTSAAAEVAFFAKVYPTPPIQARGYFVAAKTSGLVKILMVDRKVRILPPGISEFYHDSEIRHTSLSEEMHAGIEPGVLFIYLTAEKENEREFPQGSHVPVERNGKKFTVPSALGEILDIMYPPTASSDLPLHMESLLKYFHMLNKHQGMEETVHNKHYVELLDESTLDEIVDILVASVDFLKPGITRRILEVFGKKIDAIGGVESLKEYGALLGFIMKV
ncbi:hypothetical protein Bca52824_085271 [Brassica carinata]|uniref:Uncharacterized protein n=1 Tax=Brassica carinata TaxID=52824 RepID=A0A8X7P7H1_BRACI|nr:hypothetical protein Bca52824_085271 [Brassica carinata]